MLARISHRGAAASSSTGRSGFGLAQVLRLVFDTTALPLPKAGQRDRILCNLLDR